MQKFEVTMRWANILTILGIALLLLTGHAGVASSFANFYFIFLLIQIFYSIFKL